MTAIVEDEILLMFVEESIEHLQTIETDMLEIEQQGENLDNELINKIFRAAHSIKGGSGFLGLETIKELSHRVENILDMIRNKELVPNSEIVNTVLKAFDRLDELINDAANSNDEDVSEHIVALEGLTSANLADDEKDSINNMVEVSHPKSNVSFQVTEFDLKHGFLGGKYMYILEYDLIHDVQQKNKSPFDVLKLLEETGVILEIEVGLAAVGDLDSDEVSTKLPMGVLFASIIEPDLMDHTTGLSLDKIHIIEKNQQEDSASEEKLELVATEELNEIVEQKQVAKPKPKPKPKPKKKAKSGTKKTKTAAPSTPSRESLRVNIQVLDQLMNSAGELVLARNQLMQAIKTQDGYSLEQAGQRIDMVSSELQESIMLTRMQPISVIFSKFPRVVRDLSQELGKDIDLQLEGKEVELDKTIIEGLGDPLTHLVRNSVDHGVEMPDVRKENGKPEKGKIILKAFHESGHVNINIIDDGKGIDPDVIAMKAVEKGLYSEEQIEDMSEKEKINLIMLPGFSTAEQVTEVSGRGVGMDVVKTNLDKLGGTVEIDSTLGEGSVIKIKLPLTLAIIPSLLVSVAENRFALPQVNVREVLSISEKQLAERIKKVGDADVLILRGELIPLLELSQVLNSKKEFFNDNQNEYKKDRRKSIGDERIKESLGTQKDKSSSVKNVIERRTKQSELNIVIAQAGVYQYGLVVDGLHDSIEIVIKPLGHHLKAQNVYSGATILGDGHVALILDVTGLARKSELRTSINIKDSDKLLQKDDNQKTSDITQTLLTFHNGPEEYCAVHLEMVDRVEQIKPSDIEIVSGKKVIQYRNASLPVYALEEVSNVDMLEDREELVVIVFKIAKHEFGLLAAPPIDTLDIDIKIDRENLRQTGIKGSAIINGHTTIIVDVIEFTKTLNPDWFIQEEQELQTMMESEISKNDENENKDLAEDDEEFEETSKKVVKSKKSNAKQEETNQGKVNILLVEDSDFFRAQVKKFLEDTGYNVDEAEDGQVAWDFLNANPQKIQLAVVDLEMPIMDGFELTKLIKKDEKFKDMPVIALTSLAGEEEIAKGKQAGIDDYQIKLDKSKLISSISEYLKKIKSRERE